MTIEVRPTTTFARPAPADFQLRFRNPADSAKWWPHLVLRKWIWTPLSGNVWVGGGGQPLWHGYAGETAWFEADVVIAGFERRPRARIRVVDCPQNDSTLDEPAFRKMLKDILDASMNPIADPAQRREWGGNFEENLSTHSRFGGAQASAPHQDLDPCSYFANPSSSGSRIIALVHGHSWNLADEIPPGYCPKTNPAGGRFWAGPRYPAPRGASSNDRAGVRQDGVERWVVDSYGAERYGEPDGSTNHPRFFTRHDSTQGCNIF
jgi:hypothetical protein